MTLEDFRRQKSLSFEALAALLGLEGKNAGRTAHRYALHQRMPRPQMMRTIAEVTEGKVTANDFMTPPPRAARDPFVPVSVAA
jgi:hypothetical protein